jgi:phosphoribosyl 1,2-cyclic phosphate phosphodiesterase
MTGTLRATILGCGSSGGVPRTTGNWGDCDPSEPRNRRTRCGLLLQLWRGAPGAAKDATVVLIDTPPDINSQLAKVAPHHIDAVLYSHDHADQTHGIDDLRAFFIENQRRIPVWMDAPTRGHLMPRFRYCFEGVAGYPPILGPISELHAFEPVTIDGPGGALELLPLAQDHGFSVSLGFRAGPMGYSNDLVAMPEESFAALDGLDLWIVDALREKPHPSHAHLGLALSWIERLKPRHAVLTNLNFDMDYRRLSARLPAGVEAAYDGWQADLAV